MRTLYKSIIFLSIVILSSCQSEQKKTEKPEEPIKTTQVTKDTIVEKSKVVEQPYVYGIDISSYQGNEVDFINSKKDSIGFIICKATQGAFYIDPKFQQNWSQTKKDGFIRGAYHFYMSQNDPVQQSIHFAKTVGSLEDTDLPPVVDFEGGGIDKGQPVEEVQKGLLLFIHTTIKQLNRKPMIYTDIPTAYKYLNDPRFAEYPLWIANYVKKPQPDIPEIWKDKGWSFWQRDADYKLDNFTNDSDVFNGDISKLQEFIKSTNYNK